MTSPIGLDGGRGGTDLGRSLTTREFAWIRQFLLARTGIELKDGKEAMVMGRLDRRLRHHGLNTYAEYFELLESDADPLETTLAVDLLTTNETYFFREPAHFAFLRDVLGNARPRPGPIRVWSAASSTGEEAYTIAMTLADCLPVGQDWQVLATDISTRVLEIARRGLYPIDAAEKIPAELLRAYCLRGRDEYEGFLAMDRALRAKVEFRHANLLDLPADLGTFDVIFLRNVMIYFGEDTKRAIVQRLEQLLRPGGHLIVSHSETLANLTSTLGRVTPSIYHRASAGGGAGAG